MVGGGGVELCGGDGGETNPEAYNGIIGCKHMDDIYFPKSVPPPLP